MPGEAQAESRRLAAMMQTDIVGYTAMTQRDETVALTLLSEHNAMLRALVPRCSGGPRADTRPCLEPLLVRGLRPLRARLERVPAGRLQDRSHRQITH